MVGLDRVTVVVGLVRVTVVIGLVRVMVAVGQVVEVLVAGQFLTVEGWILVRVSHEQRDVCTVGRITARTTVIS